MGAGLWGELASVQWWETEHLRAQSDLKRKESPMSPTDAGRYADAATMASPVGEALSEPECQKDPAKLEDEAGKLTLTTDPWPPRPISTARIGLSHNAHPRPYNDPSNYLG